MEITEQEYNDMKRELQFLRSQSARWELETAIINEILDGEYEGHDSDYETELTDRIDKMMKLNNMKITDQMLLEKQLIDAAKPIKHCGDYGILWFNPKTNAVILTLGDSDGGTDNGGTSFNDIESMLKLSGISSVEIADEWSPDEKEGWKNLGHVGTVIKF